MRLRPCIPRHCCEPPTRRHAVARFNALSGICARSRLFDMIPAVGSGGLMRSTFSLIAIVIAAAVLLTVVIAVANLWDAIGDSGISAAGWVAMGLGIIVTLALGIGLMALVFISSRRGYDEGGRNDS